MLLNKIQSICLSCKKRVWTFVSVIFLKINFSFSKDEPIFQQLISENESFMFNHSFQKMHFTLEKSQNYVDKLVYFGQNLHNFTIIRDWWTLMLWMCAGNCPWLSTRGSKQRPFTWQVSFHSGQIYFINAKRWCNFSVEVGIQIKIIRRKIKIDKKFLS